MGRKHQRRPGAAASASAGEAGLPAQQQALAQSQSLLEEESTSAPEPQLPFHSASLVVRAAAGLPGQLVQFLDGLRLGIFALLGCAAGAHLAGASRVLRAVLDALAAEQVAAQLRGSCLLRDAAAPREQPLLALSHLGSLAHSSLLFGAARELLGLCGGAADRDPRSAVLLDVVGGEDELCEAILGLAFPEAAAGERPRASALARLAALLFHFRPPRGGWPPALQRALGLRCRERGAAGEAQVVGSGGLLEAYLRGVGKLLPRTQAALQAAKSVGTAPANEAFMCQLLERLVYPTATAALALRLSYPVGSGKPAAAAEADHDGPLAASADASARDAAGPQRTCSGSELPWAGAVGAVVDAATVQASQSQEFLHALRELETEALPPTFAPFDLWALEAGNRYYVLLLE